jgi:citrate synthase
VRRYRASAISCTGAATRAPSCCSAWSAAPKSGQLAVAEAVLAEVRRKSLPEPNIDFAVATLARVAGMVPGAGEAVFAVARTAGWIAHALEAYAGGGPLRPRAVYTGPPAIIDP